MTPLQQKILYVMVTLAVFGISFFIYQITRPLPPLARDLPSSFEEGDKIFQQRVAHAFHEGMDEQDAIAQLKKEGFRIDPAAYLSKGHIAVYEINGIPCVIHWTVSWQTKNEHIMTNITSKYGASCM